MADMQMFSGNQLATDTISRRAAVSCISDLLMLELKGERLPTYNEVYRAIHSLPSAQPDWIPCSEGMPEEHEWIGTKKFGTTISNEVYVTFETQDGERFTRHISFQNGKLSAVDEQHMKVWYKGAKPIAWMPLPEPYKGEQNG